MNSNNESLIPFDFQISSNLFIKRFQKEYTIVVKLDQCFQHV